MTSSEFPARLSSALRIGSRLGGIVSLPLLLLLACSDPASEPMSGPTVTPGIVWANPPNCAPDAPAVSLSAERRDSVSFISLGDGDAVIARTVPGGWGGFYVTPVNGQNRSVVLLVDTTNLSAALDTLKRWYPHYSFARDSVVVRMVRWDVIQLNDWSKYLLVRRQLQNTLCGSYFDVVANRLRFVVCSDAAREAVLQRMLEIDIPCWLVAVETTFPCIPNCLKSNQPPPFASGVAGL